MRVAKFDAADVTVSAGRYTWHDNGEVPPLRPHTLSIRALEDGKRSEPADLQGHRHEVVGKWLLPIPAGDIAPVLLDGTAVAGYVHTARRATYETLTGPSVDIIYDANPGRTGSFEGVISERTPDVWAAVDSLNALRSSPTQLAQMVWGSQSIRARIVDPDATSDDEISPTNLLHRVRFSFVQVD